MLLKIASRVSDGNSCASLWELAEMQLGFLQEQSPRTSLPVFCFQAAASFSPSNIDGFDPLRSLFSYCTLVDFTRESREGERSRRRGLSDRKVDRSWRGFHSSLGALAFRQSASFAG